MVNIGSKAAPSNGLMTKFIVSESISPSWNIQCKWPHTFLWDESESVDDDDGTWEEKALRSPVAMVSLREYSNMLGGGRVHGISYLEVDTGGM